MTKRWASVVGAILVIVATACGGSGDGNGDGSGVVDDAKPMLQADGPLRGLAVSATPAKTANSPIEPRAGFTSDDTEVSAIVGVGGDVAKDTTLTVTWYRWTADGGRKLLFSHEITVKPGGGRADSQGVAKGGLARGIYETVATMDDHQVRTPWFVGEAAAPRRFLSVAAQPAESSTSAPDAGLAYFMGWTNERPPDEPPGPCTIREIDAFALLFELNATLRWGGTCTSMTLAAAVSGPLRTFASMADNPDPVGNDLGYLQMAELYCDLPGGSDMPSTVVQLVGTGSDGARLAESFTLSDPGEFSVGLETTPEVGAQVDPGDIIRLRAGAFMPPPSIGIKLLYLDDGNELIESTRSFSGATEPVACDKGRFIALLGDWPGADGRASPLPPVRYRVPDDPPPVIEICAYAEGFDGRKTQDCGNFYTGEVWAGDWQGSTKVPGCSPSVVPLHGTISFAVAADGTVSGTYAVAHDVFQCGPTVQPNARFGGPFKGRTTDDGFELDVFMGTGLGKLEITRDGNEAAGEYRVPPQQGRITLQCTSCR